MRLNPTDNSSWSLHFIIQIHSLLILYLHFSSFYLFIYLHAVCFSLSLPVCLCLSVSQGNTVESEHLSELTEEEYEAHIVQRQDLKGFLWLDAKYLNPFFTRRLTQEVTQP